MRSTHLAELAAPLPDGFVGHEDATGAQELFDVAGAQAEAVVQPHAMADDLSGKTVMFVARRGRWRDQAVLPRLLPVRLLTFPVSQR